MDGLADESPDIRSLSIKILGAMRELSIVPLLCEALEDEEEDISIDAIHALSAIIEPEQLSFLSRCSLKITARLEELINSLLKKIAAIQENRKYYNCETFQVHLEAQKADRQAQQNSETAGTIIMNQPIFNQQNATIGVNYAAEGSKQDVTQYNYTPKPDTETNQQLAQLLAQLRIKYPTKTDNEIFDILINGFATMPQNNPQNWQRWQDVFSVIFVGGIEATKMLVPVAGIPIEVLKRLYEIYDRNRKQLPGA